MDLDNYYADFDTSRTSLPIYKFRDSIIDAIQEYQILIVVGDTGRFIGLHWILNLIIIDKL
jgi:HrpA-like RNA helicase